MKTNETISILAPNLGGKGGTENVLKTVLGSSFLTTMFRFELILIDRPQSLQWLESFDEKTNYQILENNRPRIQEIFHYLRNCKSNMVIVLGPRLALIARIVKLLFKKKYKIVSWIHFSLSGSTIMNPWFLRFADAHLAISSQMIPQFKNLGIPENKVKVVLNPVTRLPEITTPYNRSDSEVNLLYVGRTMLDGQKNLRLLIDSVRCYAKSQTKMIVLHIIGSGGNQQVKDYFDLQQKEENVPNLRCIFYGWKDEPWSQLSSVDAFVLTSSFEGFGLVVAEAIAHNIPVATTNYQIGAEDIIVSGKNGTISHTETPEDIAKAINESVSYSYVQRELLYKTIENLYEDHYIRRFAEALHKILIS
ncbi:glycosyltransferase [Lactiplantibacillus plantarum]|uniref:glycosyltransferase n=1 Tax=Lactiplantibacillus plantarum TaxID=1590 RepID=UPI003C19C8F1